MFQPGWCFWSIHSNNPKSPSWFYCWRCRVPMITHYSRLFPRKPIPLNPSEIGNHSHYIALPFFVWHWWYFLTIVSLHSHDIPIKYHNFPIPVTHIVFPWSLPTFRNSTFYFWCRSLRSDGSWPWAVLAALSYFCMVSTWGGYVFVVNVIVPNAVGISGDTGHLRDVQVPSSDIFKWFKLGSMWNVFLDHHLSIIRLLYHVQFAQI